MILNQEQLYNLVTGKIKGPLAAFLRGCLFVLSGIYSGAVVILAGLYRLKPQHLGAKVISVGNITLGGTGKTTLVEYLSAKLSLAGKKVAVLSRGYKRDQSCPGSCGLGDEPAMLKERLPQVEVVVNQNRLKAAQTAIRDYASDTLILDDGMQQWKIFKDLEIVTLDAGNPFGNYHLLPAGFLREPLSALRRADIFVLTQIRLGQETGALTAKLKSINPQALIVESRHEVEGFSRLDQGLELINPDSFKGKQAALFSGIGNPEGFENCVKELGINPVKHYRFADHYGYKQEDILAIIKETKENNLEMIITTQKDAVKIRKLRLAAGGILVLRIKLNLTKNEAEFNRRLLKLYSI